MQYSHEEMLQQFFDNVDVKITEKNLDIVIPYFYDGIRELKLTIILVDDIYYVSQIK